MNETVKQTDKDELNMRLCRLYSELHGDDLEPVHRIKDQQPVVFDAIVQPISHLTVLMDIHRIFADEIEPFIAHVRKIGYEGQFAYDGLTGRIQLDFATALDAVEFKQAL